MASTSTTRVLFTSLSSYAYLSMNKIACTTSWRIAHPLSQDEQTTVPDINFEDTSTRIQIPLTTERIIDDEITL
jgi:hypothetical protein